jgi:hypothetical protein
MGSETCLEDRGELKKGTVPLPFEQCTVRTVHELSQVSLRGVQRWCRLVLGVARRWVEEREGLEKRERDNKAGR